MSEMRVLDNAGLQKLIGKVKAMPAVHCGTCATAAATMPKVCSVEAFPLTSAGKPVVGTVISVKFSATNTSTSTTPQLDVNGTGAARIWYNNAALASAKSAYAGYANRHIRYMWDGTYWVFAGWSLDSNTTYANYSLGQGYGTCGNEGTAKTVTLANYALSTGGVVSVRFSVDVPAGSTMNINGKGAKPVWWRGEAIGDGVIKAGDTATFIYSTDYHLIAIDRWQADIAALEQAVESLPQTYATKEQATPLTVTAAITGTNNDYPSWGSRLSLTPSVPFSTAMAAYQAGRRVVVVIGLSALDEYMAIEMHAAMQTAEVDYNEETGEEVFGGGYIGALYGSFISNNNQKYSLWWNDYSCTGWIGELAAARDLPTKTSDLYNDSGFITASQVPNPDLSGYATKEEVPQLAHIDLSFLMDAAEQDQLTPAQYDLMDIVVEDKNATGRVGSCVVTAWFEHDLEGFEGQALFAVRWDDGKAAHTVWVTDDMEHPEVAKREDSGTLTDKMERDDLWDYAVQDNTLVISSGLKGINIDDNTLIIA